MARSSLISSQIWNKGYKAFGNIVFNTCGRRCFSEKLDAKLLSSLRKQTGYGISLCRDALRESNNDIKLARAWLDEQAIKKGWQKAEKLQGRKTGEGLIGIMVEDNHAAMVEICCETDFVAQNEFFKDLLAKATAAALCHRKMIVQRGLDLGGTFTHFREVLLTHKLSDMKLLDSEESVNDLVLQVVGRLGERIMLKRAVTMTTEKHCLIGAYTHGPFTSNIDGCQMGKYAAIVAIQPTYINTDNETLSTLAKSLSQHVVGMNPRLISSKDAQEENIDGEIFEEQNYLMNETITVKELLNTNSASIVDFLRMECGEQQPIA